MLSKAEFADLIPDFVGLSKACFGKEIPESFWRWRYLDPTDEFLAVNVKLDDGKLVANYSASSMTLSRNGSDYKCLLSMSTMTHPAYAGKGLFTTLATELYSAARDHGYVGVIGFPNANSHGGFASRLEWSDIYEIPTMSLGKAGIDADRGSLALTPATQFRADFSAPGWLADVIHIKRTREYLNWRFARNPLNDYSVWFANDDATSSSYAVTKWYGDQLDIVDFLTSDVKEAVELVRNILCFAQTKNAVQVNTWVPVHSLHRLVFEKAGFSNAAPITYFGGRGFSPQSTALSRIDADFRHFRNWYVQMSDSDVY